MKKLRMILPMLAFVLAIGMSFAYVKADLAVIQGYIETSPGVWESVDVNCINGNKECRVVFSSDPNTVYMVYPVQNPGEDDKPLTSSSLDPIVLD
ncbi:DUF6520 family protein [Imtechella halotolerans]|nr:DUF6520 family protein [Imtechella halotolerans]WMQ62098.1 DUF6520 family protein [Imtechella halotolerans]